MNFKTPKASASLDYVIPMLDYFVEKPEGFKTQKELFDFINERNPEYLINTKGNEGPREYDLSTIWNRHEIWRYIGLIKKNELTKRYFITNEGIQFTKSYKAQDLISARNIVVLSALENDYSANNDSVKNMSPISMVHSLFALLVSGKLTKTNLIKFIHYLLINQNVSEAFEFEKLPFKISEKYKRKLRDNKFFLFLINMGIIEEKNGVFIYFDSKNIYGNKLKVNGITFNPRYNILINYSDEQKRQRREAGLTYKAVVESGFICEANHQHKTFEWNNKGNQYMEGHHLLPIEFDELVREERKYKVDVMKNIYSLCPNCHSTFRSGTNNAKKELIDKLWNNRKDYYLSHNITLEYVYDLYMVNH